MTARQMRPGPLLGGGLVAIAVSWLLASCGGAGSVGFGGTGGTAPGVAEGTINGFGSVVVDGSGYAWSTDSARVERSLEVFETVSPRLGESARVEFEGAAGSEAATDVRVDAAVAGRIDAIPAADRVVVLGQTVVVNADAAAGPVTFFDGVAGVAGLAAGTAVEVHARPRWNAVAARYDLLATRISVLATVPAQRRVTGIVESVQAGATPMLRIGTLEVGYDATAVRPVGALPKAGDRVAVWTANDPVGGAVIASGVRKLSRGASDATAPTRTGGTVQRLDATAKTFEIGGTPVRYGHAAVAPQGPNFALADDVYVRVDGTLAADQVIDATKVQIRKRAVAGDPEVELSGAISAFAGAASFRVRGAPVDASAVRGLQGCGSRPLADGLQVRVEGAITAGASGSVVLADSVRCTEP